MIFSTYENLRTKETFCFGTHQTVDSARRTLKRFGKHPFYENNLRLWVVDDEVVTDAKWPGPGGDISALLPFARELPCE